MIKLQVKIICWLPLLCCCCGALAFSRKIEDINSNELQIFEDFLRLQHLKHALIVLQGTSWSAAELQSYRILQQKYRMQFFITDKSKNFQQLFYNAAPRTGILVPQLESEVIRQSVYAAASSGGYFNNTQAWLILGKHTDMGKSAEQYIIEQLGGYNINIDACITVALRRKRNDTWLLYDAYRVSSRLATPLLVELQGNWSAGQGLQLLPRFELSWIQRRRNFFNATLQGSTALLEKPAGYNGMEYLADAKQLLQLDSMQRKTYQLLRLLEDMYNMSFSVQFLDTWGQQLANGSWTGVMAQLANGKADLALCPLRFRMDRQKYIQFSPELHTQFVHFIFRHPRRNSLRNIFFEPLSSQVWWCVLALIVCSALLLMLHVQLECRLLQPLLERHFSFVCFAMLETYLQQGPDCSLFRLLSTRLLIFASCVFSFMLMQFYGAFIVGSLLSESARSIVNLPALFNSDLHIGMENVSYNFELFSNTSNQLVRDVYSKRICNWREHNILNISQGADRIRAGGFAFHVAIDRIYRVLVDMLDEHQFCELQEILFNPPYSSSVGMQKSSPWREHVAHAVLHLRATGLMQYNDKLWSVPKPDCNLVKKTQVEVDLVHFAPALITLALAMLASGVVCLLELLVAGMLRRQGQQRPRQQPLLGSQQVG